jgi:endonuclease/exonuclease/phosphatase family metal-dependent hydrolase
LIVEAAREDGIPQLDSVLIVSWNTHSGNGDLNRFIEDLRLGVLTGGRKTDHFVLLLQEVRREGPPVPRTFPLWAQTTSRIITSPTGECLQMHQIADRYDLDVFYVPAMRNSCREEPGPPEDRGGAIVSTLPLHKLTAIELPIERQRRVTIGATVHGKTCAGEPWTLSVWNVHLENRSKWYRLTRSFEEGRLRQTRFLLDAIPAGEPSVLAGDFNTWFRASEEPAVDLVRRHFPLPETIPPEKTQRRTLGIYESQVDYVFFRLPEGWCGRYRRIDDTYGSDHYPLMAWAVCGTSDPSPTGRRHVDRGPEY